MRAGRSISGTIGRAPASLPLVQTGTNGLGASHDSRPPNKKEPNSKVSLSPALNDSINGCRAFTLCVLSTTSTFSVVPRLQVGEAAHENGYTNPDKVTATS